MMNLDFFVLNFFFNFLKENMRKFLMEIISLKIWENQEIPKDGQNPSSPSKSGQFQPLKPVDPTSKSTGRLGFLIFGSKSEGKLTVASKIFFLII